MKKIKVLVLNGDGVNCEQETARAFKRLDTDVQIIHVNQFLKTKNILKSVDILALPGGFSFGDEVRSGLILAQKIKIKLKEELIKFTEENGLVLGVCNGFQVLVQLGFFGGVTLASNNQETFHNSWITVEAQVSDSPWLKDLEGKNLRLPIRHAEGRLIVAEKSQYKPAFKYKKDVNGSFDNIAGITDISGNVLGLMPHPEAALDEWLYPFDDYKIENKILVTQIFNNAVEFSRSKYE